MFFVLPAVAVQAQTHPTVNGAVFGGGRMADVQGNTVVTVVNCDTISAVYGGNDIAGTVVGANGSSITVGTATGNTRGETDSRVSIGSVYGGGNGYYKYDGNNPGPAVGVSVLTSRTFSTGVTDVDGSDVYTTSGTIPSIGKTSITVNTDLVYIDSLFGGAKNAFVTNTAGNSTDIAINGGTIYSVFGGNNYGGTLGSGSTHNILVAGTKTNTASSVNLGGTMIAAVPASGIAAKGTAWTAAGDVEGHGIRYLFGGGNKVAGQNVAITVNGGQIDTLFAGGNSADVGTTSVTVNVTSPLYQLSNSPYTDPATYAYSTTTSVYDIRCLFGGNNAADMSGLPTLTLTKGGVHNVYGGGNKGVMNAAVAYTDNYVRESITPTNTTNHGAGATRSTNVVVSSNDFLADTIYGGGQSAGTLHDTYVEIAGGHVGVVYGGTNIQGSIGAITGSTPYRDVAKTNVFLHGGTVYNAVFGASNGYYRCHNGVNYDGGSNTLFADPDAYSWLASQPTPSVYNSYTYITTGATVLGNVYGGGNMAVVGKPAAVNSTGNEANMASGIALLHIDGGTIGAGSYTDADNFSITTTGNVYGGGNMGCIYGGTSLVVSGSPLIYGNVYGGNDKTGRVFSPLRGNVSVLELIHASSAAAVSVSHSEYDGIPVDITAGQGLNLTSDNADAYTLITDTPKILGTVYGGGNGDYTYYSSYSAYEADAAAPSRDRVVINCSTPPDANQKSSFVDINVAKSGSSAGYVNRVFGGGNSKTSGHAFRGSTEEFGSVFVYMNCTGDDPASNASDIQVGTIFGGNNNVAMDVIPRIVMLKGKVGTVYGGGNMGEMTAGTAIEGKQLSTYVATVSDKVVVAKNIYGGCNVADVTNYTYVELSKGTVLGNTFGGNDLSGEVQRSYVLVNGPADGGLTINGNVYGGGNGDYAFYRYSVEEGTGKLYYKADPSSEPQYAPDYVTHPYINGKKVGTAPNRTLDIYYQNLKGRPYVDSTEVVLNGEFTMNGNVYGGGISGDCRKTRVLVDAADGDINGMIFGAGRGRVENMGVRIDGTCHDQYFAVAYDKDNSGQVLYHDAADAMGNVLDTAWLTVLRFKSMGGRSAMFGGGQSGNVGTTVVNYENTAVNHLKALYLGCLASNVTNAATGVINGDESDLDDAIIDTIYGGNDFSGRVERTELTVNSGVFVHLFGAGNGDYHYKEDIAAAIAAGKLSDENTTRLAVGGCYDTVPYSMDVNIDINGGHFLNTVYGGGNMGLVGDRDMLASDMTTSNADRADYIGAITLNIHGGEFHRHVFAGARGKADMEGKKFFAMQGVNNVDGQPLGKQLAYAQKIINMDSGHVAFSVYGGSEAVDDGFPYECIGAVNYAANPAVNTTLRPSTIMNITGGRIEKSIYGGGYQGNIYGSVYVNVGIDAVRDCPAWNKSFGNFNVFAYKPNLVGHSGYTMTNTYDAGQSKVVKERVDSVTVAHAGNPTLKKNIIDLGASIYNASDWGEAGANAYFLTRGVFGGVTNILVDGKGYYTSLTNPFDVELPSMDIRYSIIGAGTSTEGGDVNRLITLRHYGDYACPDPSKTLYSIQRADKVILDSVFIDLYGEQDAFSAYASPSYSLCRIDTLIFRVDNILMIESPGIYIGKWASLRTDEVYDITNPVHQYDNQPKEQEVTQVGTGDIPDQYSTYANDFFDYLYPQEGGDDNCNINQCQDLGICLRLPSDRGLSNNAAARNVLMMRNGSYVKVSPFIDQRNNANSSDQTPDGLDDGDHDFGHVYGWMFLLAQDATMSYVYADTKMTADESDRNEGDGGFVSTCRCENLTDGFDHELGYTNVTNNTGTDHQYRSWTIGTNQGSRVRHITLVANAVPDGRLNYDLPTGAYDLYVKDNDSPEATGVTIAAGDDYAYATTTLELPPANGGNFYVINSVLIDQDNGGQLKLVDQGYENKGNIFFQTASQITEDLDAIGTDPDYTFGLAFASDENFNGNDCWNTNSVTFASVTAPGVQFTRNLTDDGTTEGNRYACWEKSLISGNQYITNQGGYISNAIISDAVGAIPTMQFTLTYNKNIHTTVTRDVIFNMFEFDKDGNFVGPVEVTVTISTVIKEFADLEAPVLAMFNEGITNEYVRKITIPASFLQRDIYITGIEWMKDTLTTYEDNGNQLTVYSDPLKAKWFNLQEYTGAVPGDNNHFSIIVKPTESTSENINNTLGWYHIAHPEGVDVYKLAREDYEATTHTNDFSTDGNGHRRDSIYRSWDYDLSPTEAAKETQMAQEGHGYWLGTLDGRSTASIDVSLKFNGLWYYRDQFVPPLAWVRLRCEYFNTKTTTDTTNKNNEFWIYIKVRTRLEGDTIYMAPGKTLTRIAKVDENNTKTLMMHAYGYGYNEATDAWNWEPDANATPNYNLHDRATKKELIKNNPNNYLQDFRQVMDIFDEGDVIDIMETIPVYKGDEPTTVMGDDYSIIQIIRYSGSHYKFPTMACANYNPLVEVRDNGHLTMRNVWFNGSGCTRTKPAGAGAEQHTDVGSYSFYDKKARVNQILYAQSPIVYVHGHGEANFTKNVIFSNNFNDSYDRNPSGDAVNDTYIGGGAIALVNDNPTNAQGDHIGAAPSVTIGDMGHVYNNVVVDWNAASGDGTTDSLPRNYGGGVYVDGGQFILGGGNGAVVNIERNYYLKNTTDNNGIRVKTAYIHNDATDETTAIPIPVYYLDTLNYAQAFSLSNVYLTRKSWMCDEDPTDGDPTQTGLTRRDKQSDVVYFISQLGSESKVGISKWFPGYVYTNSRSGAHLLNEDTPRDTITIARVGRGTSNTSMVDNNYTANIFFNDSAFYSIANHVPTLLESDGNASFENNYPAVTYSGNTTGYPNYNDNVFIYRHTSLSPYNIYFQRCASFGKGVIQQLETSECFANNQNLQFNTYAYGDSISYHLNKDATCALAMDTLQFRVGGGFFPYTYKWYDVSDEGSGGDRRLLHSRTTVGSNAISRFGSTEYARLRTLAEFDTLVFRMEISESYARHNYDFEVVATDLTGHCQLRQPVKVRAVKIANDHHDEGHFMYDYANFLQHRKNGAVDDNDASAIAAARAVEKFYRIESPGVDSSSFHDHAGTTPRHDIYTATEQQAINDGADATTLGGLRRAGYTHTADCSGTNDDMSGKPYKGDGSCDVGDMTPRYLRVFQSFRIKPSIYPTSARGHVVINDVNGNLLEDVTTGHMNDDDYLTTFEVCPGEVLNLVPTPSAGSWDFIGWNFDPSQPANATFVVGSTLASNNPTIFYVPGDYWWQHVTSFQNTDAESPDPTVATRYDYDQDYYGDVTIRTEKGLAWLISKVNGYNNQNAQTFHFNTITLDSRDGKPFDMQAHKWTPLGNENNPFEGVFDGNGQHVSNVLVNETTIQLVGMFGYTKGATIKDFFIDSTMVRGNTYVSAVVGEATEGTLVDNITIQRGAIFGEYCIGGLISHMLNSTLSNCRLWNQKSANEHTYNPGRIMAFGNGIYAGGFVGDADGSRIFNNSTQNLGYIDISKLSTIYVGAFAGHSKSTIDSNNVIGGGKTLLPSTINNNYARLVTSSSSQRVGGLVGYAEDVDMNNNYVYGDIDYDKSYGFAGGLVGFIGENVSVNNCYYINGMTDDAAGYSSTGYMPQKSTTFKGTGNNVVLSYPVDGYENLTRALNAWVRDHNDADSIYKTWRSDLESVNAGLPLFGQPDLIPVNDTVEMAACGSFDYDGLTFYESGVYLFHIVDSSDFVDSTLTLMLTINYGDSTAVSDTVAFGNGYEGNGFSISADELTRMLGDSRVGDIRAIQFVDSLQSVNGCDSLVVLTLYVVGGGVGTPEVQKLVDVKVYPNPTRGIVNVEGSDLLNIEVYDNVSRRVLNRKVDGDRTTFDLSGQPSGNYYIRVRTAHGTVVKKVIKK